MITAKELKKRTKDFQEQRGKELKKELKQFLRTQKRNCFLQVRKAKHVLY